MLSTFKKYAVVAGSAAVLAAGMGTAARAEDAPQFAYTLTITGVSDYIFRGISFTNEKPAFQPYLELTYGIGYVGFWGSNIDNAGIYGPFEVDIYAGIRPVLGPVNFDIGVLYYQYASKDLAGLGPGGRNARSSDLDYVEFQIAATTSPIENLTLGLKGYFTPDQGYAISDTGTIEGSINYTLPAFTVGTASWVPTIGGALGYTTSGKNGFYNADLGLGYFLGDDAYTYWNAGVKITVEKFFMDFRYWDTDINAATGFNGGLADSRFLFSAGVALP
jgi:uncharacterized protein (TIGR02001 family)